MKQALLLFLFTCLFTIGLQAQSSDNFALANADQLKKNIRIFPNPTSDYINLSESDDIAQIKIMDMLGREVKTFMVVANRAYNVKDLDTGMYFIKLISNDNKVVTTKRLQKR